MSINDKVVAVFKLNRFSGRDAGTQFGPGCNSCGEDSMRSNRILRQSGLEVTGSAAELYQIHDVGRRVLQLNPVKYPYWYRKFEYGCDLDRRMRECRRTIPQTKPKALPANDEDVLCADRGYPAP